jgi:hypothetical protein
MSMIISMSMSSNSNSKSSSSSVLYSGLLVMYIGGWKIFIKMILTTKVNNNCINNLRGEVN